MQALPRTEKGKCAECPWRQPSGEKKGHQIPPMLATEPGAVQPGEELTGGPIVASMLWWVLKSRELQMLFLSLQK